LDEGEKDEEYEENYEMPFSSVVKGVYCFMFEESIV